MNKKYVNDKLPCAIDAIKKCGIADKEDKVDKTYRGQISSFGAAVAMGSFKAAVAFFSDKGSASVDRFKLIQAMDYVVGGGEKVNDAKVICKNILSMSDPLETEKLKTQYLDASIAIKLAMNTYNLI